MKKSKIILFNPKSDGSFPLALLAVGSVLDPAKYNVIIIDSIIENDYKSRIDELLENALCVGISVLTGTTTISEALDFSNLVKEINKDIPVIWGGWHPSLFPEEPLLNHSCIDITVQAQGEITFKELVYHIENKLPLDTIKGIAFRNNGKIVKNIARLLVPLESLDKVNYDLVKVEEYFKRKSIRTFEFLSSVGCLFRCTFCADPVVYNRKYSSFSGQNLGEQIQYYKDKYHFVDVNFMDELFFTYEKRVNEFSAYLIDNQINISWSGTLRADQGKRMSEETWLLAKKSGLKSCSIGIESGSQRILDWLKKDIKLENIYYSCNKCRELDIGLNLTFIVGFPNETIEDVRETFKLILELSEMSPKFNIWLFYYKPFPGSIILDEITQMGHKLPTTTTEWGNFDFYGNLGPWVSEEMSKEIKSFAFYHKLVYGTNLKNKSSKLFKWSGKWRLKRNKFSLPFEKYLLSLTGNFDHNVE